jgi:hypothetical protein
MITGQEGDVVRENKGLEQADRHTFEQATSTVSVGCELTEPWFERPKVKNMH